MYVKKYIALLLVFIPVFLFAQEVALFQQFNGHYDYKAFGNTLNTQENGSGVTCDILTESSADFTLQAGQQVVAAYLYWAGSASPGDFEVTLNGTSVTAEREFSHTLNSNGESFEYFAAFADVTNIITQNGNTSYTLSDLDLNDNLSFYCEGNSTNFGGWAVTVIYEDANLPLNQVNIFDGLEAVSVANNNLDIVLNNLNVLDNTGAKIGFLAWEGDSAIAVNESLRINGSVISNPPLNPANNAFNGTNSFTGSSELFNMDIDVYSIENNISPGDSSAIIQLSSGQDLVMINNIVTVLNTELPDATITIDSISGETECGNRNITVNYTVSNINSTGALPANTPIAFYANDILIAQGQTISEIPMNGSESEIIIINIPQSIPEDFILKAVVDDLGNGNGIVVEIDEDNNEAEISIHLLRFPEEISLINLEQCGVNGSSTFNLTSAVENSNTDLTIQFFTTETNAENNTNPIANPESYISNQSLQTIYIRVENTECFIIQNFTVTLLDCTLADATITLGPTLDACRDREFNLSYTVYNENGTDELPAATPISFYSNNILLGISQTQNQIPIQGSETGAVTLTFPEGLADVFLLLAVVDDTGNGNGIIEELDETNNTFESTITFVSIAAIGSLPTLNECNEGFSTATFDLTVQNEMISTLPEDVITYFISAEDAISNINSIQDPEQFQNTSDPQEIYVRLENNICFTTASFLLTTKNCPPFIPEGFSPNNDGINDVFEISGLLNIFTNFSLQIYSREGNLIYDGKNTDGFWKGIPNTGLLQKETLVPVGAYFYVLYLDDPIYPKPYTGIVYINY